jgi:hypothetical protein
MKPIYCACIVCIFSCLADVSVSSEHAAITTAAVGGKKGAYLES